MENKNCSVSSSTDYWRKEATLATNITCTLSILGGVFVIFSFLAFPEFKRAQSRKILVLLSACDIGIAVSYLMSVSSNFNWDGPVCKLQSALNIFSNQAAFLWTDFLALFLFLSRRYGIRYASAWIPIFHMICWFWCISIVSLTGILHAWGHDGRDTANWCWIDSKASPWWRIVAGKMVEWGSTVFIVIIYGFIVYETTKHREAQPQILWPNQPGNRDVEKKLLLIPLLFVITRIPGDMRIIGAALNHCLDFKWLIILQAIGDSGQGIMNALLFGLFTPKVRQLYKNLIWKRTTDNSEEPYDYGYGSLRSTT